MPSAVAEDIRDAAAEDLRERVEQLESVPTSVQNEGRSWDSGTQSTAGAPALLPDFLPPAEMKPAGELMHNILD
jgi:hypothetical protein